MKKNFKGIVYGLSTLMVAVQLLTVPVMASEIPQIDEVQTESIEETETAEATDAETEAVQTEAVQMEEVAQTAETETQTETNTETTEEVVETQSPEQSQELEVEVLEEGTYENEELGAEDASVYSEGGASNEDGSNLYLADKINGSVEEMAAEIRTNMVARNGSIDVFFSNYTQGIGTEALTQAVAYQSGIANDEGDYLRFNYARYEMTIYKITSGSDVYYKVTYKIDYLSSRDQENEVDAAIRTILDGLDVYNSTDFGKIKAVYDWLGKNVNYDNTSGDHAGYSKYSAYAAAVQKSAVCQGYTLLSYRLLNELGIANRAIPGNAGGVKHIWNIVPLYGLWYNLDTTWGAFADESGTRPSYDTFLRGSTDYPGHVREAEYETDAFNGAYPMSQTKYEWQAKSDTEAFVTRLYQVFLDRSPDASGLAMWTEELSSFKKTGAQVAYGFVFSDEFSGNNPSDENFVEYMYKGFLGRDADEGGKATWVENLSEGLSREFVYRGFAESAEFTELCRSYGIERGSVNLVQWRDRNELVTKFINRCYKNALGRNGEPDGLNAWAEAMLTNKNTAEAVAESFLFSNEFLEKNMSNKDFVKVLYNLYLDRNPDAAGESTWVAALEGGQTRQDVARGFSRSDEFKVILSRFNL